MLYYRRTSPAPPRPGRLPAGLIGATRRPGCRARADASSPGPGAVNLTRGQHDCGTSRLVDSDGLAAHLLASHGPGPTWHHHRTPTRTGPTTTGPRSTRTYPVTPAPVATPVQMPPSTPRPCRTRDHGIRVSSSPSRPGHHWPGPSTSMTSGHPGLVRNHSSRASQVHPLIRVSSFPQIPPLTGHSFFL
jgi:hypothetical protein